MISQFLTEWLSGLPLPERTRALDSIMYDLTICARDFQGPSAGSEDKSSVLKKLLGLNELYHQLSQQIGHYLDGEEKKVYPVDVFSQIRFDKATECDIVSLLKSSITHAKTGRWSGKRVRLGYVAWNTSRSRSRVGLVRARAAVQAGTLPKGGRPESFSF